MNKEKINKILYDLESGYDLIADKFSSTRAFMWRDLEFAKDLVKPEDRVLDFGCGNGRLAGFLENKFEEFIGVDISQKLIDEAREKFSNEKIKFLKIDPTDSKLPFEDNSFDIVFSIAVFHHFPGKEYRLQVAKELYRVLRPGGKLVVSVWNLWQRRFWKYHLRFDLKNKLDWGDILVPFKAEEKIFERYHHAFRKRELKKLLAKSEFQVSSCRKNYNIICVALKK